jgi:hypothetical protein
MAIKIGSRAIFMLLAVFAAAWLVFFSDQSTEVPPIGSGIAPLPAVDPLPASNRRLAAGQSGYLGAVSSQPTPVPESFVYGAVNDAVMRTETLLRRERGDHVSLEASSAKTVWTVQAGPRSGPGDEEKDALNRVTIRLDELDGGRHGLTETKVEPLAEMVASMTRRGTVQSKRVTFPAFSAERRAPSAHLARQMKRELRRWPVPFAPDAVFSERYYAERADLMALIERLTGVHLPEVSLRSAPVEGGVSNAGWTTIADRQAVLLTFHLEAAGETRASAPGSWTGPSATVHGARVKVEGYQAIDVQSGLVAEGYLRVLFTQQWPKKRQQQNTAIIATTTTTF